MLPVPMLPVRGRCINIVGRRLIWEFEFLLTVSGRIYECGRRLFPLELRLHVLER